MNYDENAGVPDYLSHLAPLLGAAAARGFVWRSVINGDGCSLNMAPKKEE